MQLTKGAIKRVIKEEFSGREFTNRDVYEHFESILGRGLTDREKMRIAGIVKNMAVRLESRQVGRERRRITRYLL